MEKLKEIWEVITEYKKISIGVVIALFVSHLIISGLFGYIVANIIIFLAVALISVLVIAETKKL